MTGPVRRPAATELLLPAVLVACALLAGCSGPRSGTSAASAVDGCATVLPLASQEVGAGPTLVSVHALRRGEAARYLRELGAAVPTASPSGQGAANGPTSRATAAPRECLVVYRGPVGGQALRDAPAGASGQYALLFLDVRHPQVRRVVLTDVLPAALRRS